MSVLCLDLEAFEIIAYKTNTLQLCVSLFDIYSQALSEPLSKILAMLVVCTLFLNISKS